MLDHGSPWSAIDSELPYRTEGEASRFIALLRAIQRTPHLGSRPFALMTATASPFEFGYEGLDGALDANRAQSLYFRRFSLGAHMRAALRGGRRSLQLPRSPQDTPRLRPAGQVPEGRFLVGNAIKFTDAWAHRVIPSSDSD